MILIICLHCRSALRVLDDAEEVHRLVGEQSEFWPDKYPCATCEHNAKGMLEMYAVPKALEHFDVTTVTAAEAFAALHGLGLPKERDCKLLAVAEYLRGNSVSDVRGVTVNGRAVVESITLSNGLCLHFGASSHGAVVYRVTTQDMNPSESTAC